MSDSFVDSESANNLIRDRAYTETASGSPGGSTILDGSLRALIASKKYTFYLLCCSGKWQSTCPASVTDTAAV